MIEPTPMAPRYIIEPKCPIITLSTKPTNGIVILEIIKGIAIFRVFLSILEKLLNNVAYVTSIMSKSSLVAPQSGQAQFSGISSHLVPGFMPSSGQPRLSSYIRPQIKQRYFFIIFIACSFS